MCNNDAMVSIGLLHCAALRVHVECQDVLARTLLVAARVSKISTTCTTTNIAGQQRNIYSKEGFSRIQVCYCN